MVIFAESRDIRAAQGCGAKLQTLFSDHHGFDGAGIDVACFEKSCGFLGQAVAAVLDLPFGSFAQCVFELGDDLWKTGLSGMGFGRGGDRDVDC